MPSPKTKGIYLPFWGGVIVSPRAQTVRSAAATRLVLPWRLSLPLIAKEITLHIDIIIAAGGIITNANMAFFAIASKFLGEKSCFSVKKR